MNMFLSISLLLIFVLWLNYEIHKTTKLSKKGSKAFWAKETLANQKRPEDISGLDYIEVPFDKLPRQDVSDATINSYRDSIFSLSDKSFLNLSSLTNTELKLKYGVSNLNVLSEYDDNYTKLVSILQKWGERLSNQDFLDEAISVLEVAVDCKTDVIKTYELLADIYAKQNTPNKINTLLAKIPPINIRDKENLMLKLDKQRK